TPLPRTTAAAAAVPGEGSNRIGSKFTLCMLMTLVALGPGRAQAQATESIHAARVIRLKHDGPAGKPSVITALAIEPGGKSIAAAGDDHVVRIFGVADGQMTHELKGHRDWVRSLAFNPHGKYLTSAGDDHRILFWKTA